MDPLLVAQALRANVQVTDRPSLGGALPILNAFLGRDAVSWLQASTYVAGASHRRAEAVSLGSLLLAGGLFHPVGTTALGGVHAGLGWQPLPASSPQHSGVLLRRIDDGPTLYRFYVDEEGGESLWEVKGEKAGAATSRGLTLSSSRSPSSGAFPLPRGLSIGRPSFRQLLLQYGDGSAPIATVLQSSRSPPPPRWALPPHLVCNSVLLSVTAGDAIEGTSNAIRICLDGVALLTKASAAASGKTSSPLRPQFLSPSTRRSLGIASGPSSTVQSRSPYPRGYRLPSHEGGRGAIDPASKLGAAGGGNSSRGGPLTEDAVERRRLALTQQMDRLRRQLLHRLRALRTRVSDLAHGRLSDTGINWTPLVGRSDDEIRVFRLESEAVNPCYRATTILPTSPSNALARRGAGPARGRGARGGGGGSACWRRGTSPPPSRRRQRGGCRVSRRPPRRHGRLAYPR